MHWPDKVRKKVVRTWLQTGNLEVTAKLCKIPYDTVHNWRYRQQWWKDLVDQFQDEADVAMAGRIKKLLGKSVEQLEDRIENGDSILDSKTGDVIKVPLKARDLTNTVKVLSDREDILIGRQVKEATQTEQITDKLAMLAKEFAKFSNKGTPTLDITDAEYSLVEAPTRAVDEGKQE
jgi:hypothetical protein